LLHCFSQPIPAHARSWEVSANGAALEQSLPLSEVTDRLQRVGIPLNQEDKDRLALLLRNYCVTTASSDLGATSADADTNSYMDPQTSLFDLCAALDVPLTTNVEGLIGSVSTTVKLMILMKISSVHRAMRPSTGSTGRRDFFRIGKVAGIACHLCNHFPQQWQRYIFTAKNVSEF
jgi:hypothetical protein